MWQMVIAQGLKSKGSRLVPASIALSLVYGLLAAGYVALRGQDDISFNSMLFFCLIFHIAVQFSSAGMIASHVDLDRQAGHFANECRSCGHRVKTMAAKLIAYTWLLTVVAVAAGASFLFFLQVFQVDTPAESIQCLMLLLSMGSFFILPLLCVYLWAAYVVRMTGTLLMGAFLVLSSILFGTTGLGTGLWHFLPMTWGLKWLTLYGDMAGSTEVLAAFTLGLVVKTCVVVLMLCGILMWWFTHCEGQARWDA